jgi:hypothetical protein
MGKYEAGASITPTGGVIRTRLKTLEPGTVTTPTRGAY